MSARTLHAMSALASALLLFLVEPMIAKAALPLYGGSPAVWNTCLLFFQGLLLAGYAYAHYGASWLGHRAHLVVHAALVAAPLALLPLAAPTAGPPPSAWPVPSLLAALAASVGLPFFVLSSNSSMVQRWHALRSGESPYFLYAASNVGSFVALFAYPFVVEPAIGLRAQMHLWSIGYLAFVALSGAALVGAWRGTPVAASAPRGRASLPRLRWLVRAAVPAALLPAVSLAITTDVAAIPLLWVVPLGLYLATFVLAFWPRFVYPRRLLATVAALGIVLALGRPNLLRGHLLLGLALPLGILFVGSLLCHADLARDRPGPEHVTEYYLFIALGGFCGGVLGTVIAPLAFNSIAEYPLSLAGLVVLFTVGDGAASGRLGAGGWLRLGATAALVLAWAAVAGPAGRMFAWWSWVPLAGLAASLALWRKPGQFAAACVCVALVHAFGVFPGDHLLEARRSFFGLMRVFETDGRRQLIHGTTMHGAQKVAPFSPEPLLYYAPLSPMSRVVHIQREGARIAVVGLGTGSLAYYAQAGRTLRFYEIDPTMEPLARRWFTFLDLAECALDVRVGDARLTLAEAPDGALDLLLVDAFSSDAIPVHLLTVEAMQLYLGKLKPDGLIVLHISNLHIDLVPVLRAVARALGLAAAIIRYLPDPETPHVYVEAVALARGPSPLQPLFDRGWQPLGDGRAVLWTDDRSNLLSVVGR
jgi:hypothetical protein